MLIIDKIVGKRADAAPFKLLFGLETFEEAGQEGDEDSSRKKKKVSRAEQNQARAEQGAGGRAGLLQLCCSWYSTRH